jgi:hypothetical protein
VEGNVTRGKIYEERIKGGRKRRIRKWRVHCKKWFAIFPSPAGMSLTKLSLVGNYKIIPGRGEFGK